MLRRLRLLAASLVIAGPAFAQGAESYLIGPEDVVHVIVLGQDSLTGDFTIGTDGMLTFPFLGKVKAEGWSAVELERKLTTLLADGYLRRPQVSVSIKEFRSQRVYVTGEVGRPGPYGLRPNRSLHTLLQDIGPLNDGVGHEIIVIRPPAGAPPTPPPPSPPPPAEGDGNGDGQPVPEPTPSPSPTPPPRAPYPGEVAGSEVFRLNLRDVRSGYPDKDMRLQAGDTVYFPRAAQIYLTGHVTRPGTYRYEEGMTVFQALALAGGANERGAEGRARIVRIVEGKKKEVKAQLTDVLQPEDIVHVPERFF
jgi:polysaccharide export outer membrane protein